tara:strand:- start:521 stop:676 length:156 start_codon:yes stop_codon:yes gene_type:complete
MKLFGLIAGSVVLGLLVAASLTPTEAQTKYRHFKKLEQAGIDRYESYGSGM